MRVHPSAQESDAKSDANKGHGGALLPPGADCDVEAHAVLSCKEHEALAAQLPLARTGAAGALPPHSQDRPRNELERLPRTLPEALGTPPAGSRVRIDCGAGQLSITGLPPRAPLWWPPPDVVPIIFFCTLWVTIFFVVYGVTAAEGNSDSDMPVVLINATALQILLVLVLITPFLCVNVIVSSSALVTLGRDAWKVQPVFARQHWLPIYTQTGPMADLKGAKVVLERRWIDDDDGDDDGDPPEPRGTINEKVLKLDVGREMITLALCEESNQRKTDELDFVAAVINREIETRGLRTCHGESSPAGAITTSASSSLDKAPCAAGP